MAYIGDVAHIAHFISQMIQITEQDIERNGRTSVSQVCVAINGRAAHIHSHVRSVQRNERFLSAAQRIVNNQFIFHNPLYLIGLQK